MPAALKLPGPGARAPWQCLTRRHLKSQSASQPAILGEAPARCMALLGPRAAAFCLCDKPPLRRVNLLPIGKVVGSEGRTAISKTGEDRRHYSVRDGLVERGLYGQTQLLARAATGHQVAQRSWFRSAETRHPVFTGTGTTRHSSTCLQRLPVQWRRHIKSTWEGYLSAPPTRM